MSGMSPEGFGRTDQVTLHFLAICFHQQAQLFLRLDAFGQASHFHFFAKPDNRTDDCNSGFVAVLVLRKLLDKRPVDLDLGEWELEERAESGIADIEIVHYNSDAGISDGLQGRQTGRTFRHCHGLGQLQLQPGGRQTGESERRCHKCGHCRIIELKRRDVDGEADVRRPSHGILAGSLQDPLPISPMRPISSAIGMNSAGGTLPRTGWRQRNSASNVVTRCVRRLTCG